MASEPTAYTSTGTQTQESPPQQSSSLLRLPKEVRDIICSFAVPRLGDLLPFDAKRLPYPYDRRPLHICKQLRQEFWDYVCRVASWVEFDIDCTHHHSNYQNISDTLIALDHMDPMLFAPVLIAALNAKTAARVRFRDSTGSTTIIEGQLVKKARLRFKVYLAYQKWSFRYFCVSARHQLPPNCAITIQLGTAPLQRSPKLSLVHKEILYSMSAVHVESARIHHTMPEDAALVNLVCASMQPPLVIPSP